MHTDIYTHTNASQQSRDGIVQSDMLKTTLPKDRLFFFFWMNLFAKLHGFKKNLLLGEYQRESCQGQLLQFNLTSSGRRKWMNLLFFFSKCHFLILKALRARGHLKYLARHHAKGHCFSCNTSFSPAETIQPCALRPTTLLDSYFPSFHLLGVTDFHRFPSFFRLISLLFWLSFPSVALILSPLPETFIFLLLCEKAEVASSLLCSQLFVLLHIRALGLILQVDLSVSLSHFLSVFVSQGQSEAYSQTVEYVLLSVSNWSIWTLNRRGPIRVSGRQNWKSAILPLG